MIYPFPYKNGAVRGRDLPDTRRGTLHGPSSTGVKHFLGLIPLRVIERYHQSSHDSCVVSSSFVPFLNSRDVGRRMTLERGLRAPSLVRLAPPPPPYSGKNLHLRLHLRPSNLHEREGDGKRNILWGWHNKLEVSYHLALRCSGKF